MTPPGRRPERLHKGDGEACCALGALGRVLEAHGYTRVQGRHLITRVRAQGLEGCVA